MGNKPDDGTAAPSPAETSILGGDLPSALKAIVVPGRRPAPAAPARLAAPAPLRLKARPKPRGKNGLLYMMVAAGLALAASAAVLNRHWPRAETAVPALAAKKPAVDKQTGHILIPRPYSDICDRYQFDNASGAMKQIEAMPCGGGNGKKQDVNIADQINSFHSSWRGSAAAPRGNAPDTGAPGAPAAPRAR